MKVTNIMIKQSEESMSRVLLTKKIKYTWREILNKLESSDSFKLDYSIPSDILLKKIMTNIDVKCNIKSNVIF